MNKLSQFRGKCMKPWLFNAIVGTAITIIIGGAITWPGSWVSGVNAKDKEHNERLIKLETIAPRMEEHLLRQERKVDVLLEKTSNIEGQLRRR